MFTNWTLDTDTYFDSPRTFLIAGLFVNCVLLLNEYRTVLSMTENVTKLTVCVFVSD